MSFQLPVLPLILPRSAQWPNGHGLLLAQSYSPFWAPLHQLVAELEDTKKKHKMPSKCVIGNRWSIECENAFQIFKRLLVSAPVLVMLISWNPLSSKSMPVMQDLGLCYPRTRMENDDQLLLTLPTVYSSPSDDLLTSRSGCDAFSCSVRSLLPVSLSRCISLSCSN